MEKTTLEKIKCVDCKNWPNSCGYWSHKRKMHTCQGLTSAKEMNLNETLYCLNNSGAGFNSQVINKAIQFLNLLWLKSDLDLGSVRPSVLLHARKMESRLREKDKEKGKDGWHNGKLYYYLEKAAGCIQKISEIAEITFARVGMVQKANSDIKEKDIYLAIKKCFDGSNFLMMLADNLRDELLERGIKLHK